MNGETIGMRKLAEATGLSVATVSRALRGSPSVKAETKAAIVAKAGELGYAFNPYVGEMMSALRRRQGESMKGNLAMIWYDGFPHPLDSQLKEIQREAITRANELGYCLDEFDRRRHTRRGLKQILKNRGVRGVMISQPGQSSGKVHLSLDLNDFACVCLGWSVHAPALHRVRFDHFQAIRLALHYARRRAGSAIAALIDFHYDRRADGAFRGGFLAHHPAGPVEAKKLFFDVNRFDRRRFLRAAEKGRIRTLICQTENRLPAEVFTLVPRESIIYMDDRSPARRFGSVDFQYRLLSRWAVDLVVATLQGHEHGVPDFPKTLMVPPLWVPAEGNDSVGM
jgi:DNA-binding LacI/PurR family transcriptional regulator